MARAKQGDTVRVHYKGILDDGEVFDNSFDGEPLEFTIGEQRVIAGFENAVEGMEVGETKQVNIPSQ
jgi:peptidylprolyl isomerase